MRRIFNLPSSTGHPPAAQAPPPSSPYPTQILSQKDFHGLRLPRLGLAAPRPGLGSSVILIFFRSFFCFFIFCCVRICICVCFCVLFYATTPSPPPPPPLPSVRFEPFFMRFVAVFKFHFMHTLFLFLSLLIACLHTKNAWTHVCVSVCVCGGRSAGA